MTYPSVSIVIPTYNRNYSNLLQSIDNDGYLGEKEVIVQKDFNGEGCPVTFNKGVTKAKHDWIAFLGDDVIVEKHWLTYAMERQQETGKKLIVLNDGPIYPDGGNDCGHFVIHKDLIDKLENGQIFSEDFHHVGCDNWLSFQTKKLGEYCYAEKAKIIHNHFSTGKVMDDCYKKGWSKMHEDREILRKKILNYK